MNFRKHNKTPSYSPAARRRKVGAARLEQTVKSVELRKFIAATIAWGNGHQMAVVAQTYLITEITDSTVPLAVLAGSIAAASIITSFIGGILADRMSRKTLLMIGSIATSIAMLAVAILIITDNIQAWHIQIAGIVQGGSLALDWTARFALIPNMVSRRILPRAISFDLMAFNLTRIAGPLIWGWIVAFTGIEWTYMLMSAIFITNFIIISTFKPLKTTLPSTHMPIWQEIGEIAKIVRSNPIVAGNLIFTAVNALLLGSFIYLLAPFAKDVIDVDATALSQLFTALGIGAFLGSLTLGITGGVKQMGYTLLATNIIVSIAILLFAILTTFYFGLTLAFIIGLFNAIHVGLGNIVLQISISDDIRGRLAGIYEIAWSGFPIGGFVFAALAGWLSVPQSLMLVGIFVTMVTIAIATINPTLRRFKYR